MLSLHENQDVRKKFIRKMPTLWKMGDAEPQLSGKQAQYPYHSMKGDEIALVWHTFSSEHRVAISDLLAVVLVPSLRHKKVAVQCDFFLIEQPLQKVIKWYMQGPRLKS